MGLLKVSALLGALLFAFGACGIDVVDGVSIRTDTTLASDSETSLASDTNLYLQNSGGVEKRILLKLTLHTGEAGTDIGDALESTDPAAAYSKLSLAALGKLFGCEGKTLVASNLSSAILKLDTLNGSPPTVGTVSLQEVTEPWASGATWTYAHPFGNGRWSVPGGASSAIANSTNYINGIQFDLTTFFQQVINAGGRTFYGFLLKASGGTAEFRFQSSQSQSTAQRPRIEVNYSCN